VTCSTICIKQFFTFYISPPVVAAGAAVATVAAASVAAGAASDLMKLKRKLKAAPKNNFLVIELWLPTFS
jgi:hypothetical protein